MPVASLDRDAPTFVAGHRGLVGSAVLRHLEQSGFSRLVTRSSSELDLRATDAVEDFFAAERPATVVMAAAKVGGILANSTYPADFLSDNLRMQVNVLDAAARRVDEAERVDESALVELCVGELRRAAEHDDSANGQKCMTMMNDHVTLPWVRFKF